ncbi:hypothetical protein VT84_29305 [Gemmata sp. SH-PL17]|uniref:hypothetical protein n=1 Tax=Gemmata sp. SH-PL17 TaxID=1630693 RepID=UPI00078D19C2|nr:hypothetical protein [Gemmata sp. SH-PL17]AMV28539.1 hypothetical protein VT84_29305 [Gemmata sp. SH-PL17]
MIPILPTNPAAGAPSSPAPSAPATPAPTDSKAENSADDHAVKSNGRSRALLVVGIVIGGLLLAGGLAAIGIAVAKSSATPVKHKVLRVARDTDSWE